MRVLDPHVANKIAAGEVIERPASVVKELVENAVDAHATRVHVTIEKGGKQLIRVVDDGWGIGRDDLRAVFLPHATSKLEDVADLDSIATLGFRGEALASIGSVAQVRVRSREHEAESGFEIVDDGGAIGEPQPCGAAPGTEVVVRNLFFNTPARERFLRADRTEQGHIEERMRKMALAFPEIGFRLDATGKTLIDTEPGESLHERLRSLHDKSPQDRAWADALLPTSVELPHGRVTAFLGPPSLTRPNARDMRFFVNGRAISDRIVHRVVRDAYRDVLHHGRYPVAFLFFTLDPTQIDVNVHPTKAEIRWRDARFLHSVVGPALARTLRAEDLAVRMDAINAGEEPPPRTSDRVEGVRNALRDFLDRAQDAPRIHERPPQGGGAYQASLPRSGPRPSGGVFSVVQMHDSYLVCEVEDGIAIVDQHALHERVNYDRILNALMADGVEAQSLLLAEQVDLDASGQALMDEHTALLERSGFRWSAFGEATIALEAIPAAIPRERAGELVRDLVELLRVRGSGLDAKTLFHDVADTMACKASVRFGDRLSREEAQALLEESGALERAFVCPHGRPTVMRLPFAELERRFGRR
ncbi:MAG: DNA mismatch repair endonuclease MutL [Planctomycetota bacterium]